MAKIEDYGVTRVELLHQMIQQLNKFANDYYEASELDGNALDIARANKMVELNEPDTIMVVLLQAAAVQGARQFALTGKISSQATTSMGALVIQAITDFPLPRETCNSEWVAVLGQAMLLADIFTGTSNLQNWLQERENTSNAQIFMEKVS